MYFEQEKITVINVCSLYDSLNLWGKSYDKTSEAIMQWCSVNDASYYGASREDFFIYRAIELAESEGKSTVVVEDFS